MLLILFFRYSKIFWSGISISSLKFIENVKNELLNTVIWLFAFQLKMILVSVFFCLTITVAKSELSCGVGIRVFPAPSVEWANRFVMYKKKCSSSDLCDIAEGTINIQYQEYRVLLGWCNKMSTGTERYHCQVMFFLLASLTRAGTYKIVIKNLSSTKSI